MVRDVLLLVLMLLLLHGSSRMLAEDGRRRWALVEGRLVMAAKGPRVVKSIEVVCKVVRRGGVAEIVRTIRLGVRGRQRHKRGRERLMRAGKGVLGCEIHGVVLSSGERCSDENIQSWVDDNGAAAWAFFSFSPRRVRSYVRIMVFARNGGRGG